MRPFIPKETATQIYNALIVPYFDRSPVWDCLSGYLRDKLQKLQNRVARVITKLPFDTNSNHLLTTLNWERLSIRRKKLKPLMMYKTMNGHAPDYLQRLFTQYYSNYNQRNSEGKLALPKPRNNYLKRSFSYSGATLWNNLTSFSRVKFKQHSFCSIPSACTFGKTLGDRVAHCFSCYA